MIFLEHPWVRTELRTVIKEVYQSLVIASPESVPNMPSPVVSPSLGVLDRRLQSGYASDAYTVRRGKILLRGNMENSVGD
jgi:hypothetical protein